ncbi:MAG: response regulator transcription factor [Verrucomicrobiales bacterium]
MTNTVTRASPSHPPRWRVLIVDDHAILREGLAALINPDPRLEVVGFAGTVEEATTFTGHHRVDCAIVDFNLPGRSGLDFIEHLSQSGSPCLSILLTMHSDSWIGKEAATRGASATLLKNDASRVLIGRLLRLLDPSSSPPHTPILSRRENEVLSFLREGLTSKEIGVRLGISNKTVDTYRERLHQKFGVSNTAQLLHSAARHSACHPQASRWIGAR